MSSELKTNKVSPSSGTALQICDSGDTISIPSGATIANSGTATGFGGDNTPSFGVYRATDFAVSQGTWTKLPFDTEDWDTDSAFDSSTNYRFTVPSGEGGKYLMWATARPTSLTYGDTKLRLYKNGSATDYQWMDTMDSNVQIECVAILDLSASDYIEWYLYLHGSGSTLGGGTMKASGLKLVGV